MYKSTATLGDVYHLALPQETQLLVGGEFLHRPVSWACSLRPSPPAFPKLDGNELALVRHGRPAPPRPRKARLERVVNNLRAPGISGVAVLGPVSETAIAAALECRIAVLPAARHGFADAGRACDHPLDRRPFGVYHPTLGGAAARFEPGRP